MKRSVAIVGARGYTGAELLKWLAAHPSLTLAFASSSSQAGEPLASVCPEWPSAGDVFTRLEPDQVAGHQADAWVLAVPNGAAAEWAGLIGAAHGDAVVIDLSADYRFDPDWTYGLPERNRDRLRSARRIANPGCYATGAQLALLPLIERLRGVPVVFGVSGYSGAGRTPSPRNDPERLADNLIPYALTGHVHEREISAQLGREVRFLPHVAAFFRGISLTVTVELSEPVDEAGLLAHYADFYAEEPLVAIARTIPEVREVRGRAGARIGGFAVDPRDPRRVTIVSVLDNLAKGAATQALQNLNLALGLNEMEGLADG